MKKNIQLQLLFLFFISIISTSLIAQESPEKVKNEITLALQRFNNAAKNSNTDQLLALFDNSDNILFTGSDSAEIWKGKEQIKGHLNSIFPQESVWFDMNRIDIDHNGNTAWVFVDGYINITTDKGEKIKAPYRFSGILVKKNQDWKWRSFSGSSPAGK